jgi:hypothetical protein
MAKKKSSTTKGGTKKGGTKKKGTASAQTASKSGTPKAKKSGGAKKGAAKKKAAAPKLNDRQLELLRKVHSAGPEGYFVGQKVEQRTIDALHQRKLLKRGPKHKEKKAHPYHVTKTGAKHVGSAGGSSVSGASPTF